MKRLIGWVLVLALTVFTFSSCVDIDEALPHYSTPHGNSPQAVR